jgi:hypothetical protein
LGRSLQRACKADLATGECGAVGGLWLDQDSSPRRPGKNLQTSGDVPLGEGTRKECSLKMSFSGISRGKISSVAGKGPARGVVGERTQVLRGKVPLGEFSGKEL